MGFYGRKEEIPQARLRLIITLLVIVYILSHKYVFGQTDKILHIYIGMFAFVLAISLYYLALLQTRKPQYKDYYRYLGMVSDNLILTVGFAYGGKIGGALFCLYLFIAFGNGIRFGGRYMFVSATLSLVCFTYLVYISPYWHSEEHIYTSVGLALSLIVLPLYVMKLIRELQTAYVDIEIANDAKSKFIANMNHELRTPLTSIIQACSLLKKNETVKDNDGEELLKIISSSASHQLKIVNKILEISKIRSNVDFIENNSTVEIGSVVSEVRDMVMPQCREKGLGFSVFIDSRIEPRVISNGVLLKQILINLCSNSVKFTERGEIILSVVMVEEHRDKQTLRFQVRDTGIGVSEEIKERIFEAFNQGNNEITRQYGGTGLGITISKEYAELLGGQLLLDEQCKDGARFYFESVFVNSGGSDIAISLKERVMLYTIGIRQEELESLGVSDHEMLTVKSLDDIILFDEIIDNVKSHKEGSVLLVQNDQLKQIVSDPKFKTISYHLPVIGYCKDDFVFDDDNYSHRVLLSTIYGKLGIENVVAALQYGLLIKGMTYRRDTSQGNLIEINRALKILAIEDTDALQRILELIFKERGHEITLCSDGIEGIEALKREHFDIGLVDLHMPKMSGLDFVKYYRSIEPDNKMPFLLMTADTMKSDNDEISKYFASVITKPILPENLLEAVYQTYLKSKKSNDNM